MNQLKIILKRLKNPSVLISIASQIVSMLVLLNVDIDAQLVMGIIAGLSSILVALGIISNPDTKKKSFGDDLLFCEHCGKISQHTVVAGKLICKECGHVYSSEKKISKE